ERLARLIIDALVPEHDAAQLDRRIPEGMPLDRVGGLPVEEDRQVVRLGDFISEASPAPVAVRPPGLLRLAILDFLEDDVVGAQDWSPLGHVTSISERSRVSEFGNELRMLRGRQAELHGLENSGQI